MALWFFQAKEKGAIVITLGEMNDLDLTSKNEDDGFDGK